MKEALPEVQLILKTECASLRLMQVPRYIPEIDSKTMIAFITYNSTAEWLVKWSWVVSVLLL